MVDLEGESNTKLHYNLNDEIKQQRNANILGGVGIIEHTLVYMDKYFLFQFKVYLIIPMIFMEYI